VEIIYETTNNTYNLIKEHNKLQTLFHPMHMTHMHYQIAFLFSPITAHWTLEHSRFATLITFMPP